MYNRKPKGLVYSIDFACPNEILIVSLLCDLSAKSKVGIPETVTVIGVKWSSGPYRNVGIEITCEVMLTFAC